MAKRKSSLFRNVGWLMSNLGPVLRVCFAQVVALKHSALGVLAVRWQSDKGPDKHDYTAVYEQILLPIRYSQITVLEIGLLQHSQQKRHKRTRYRSAPSLHMWRRYLPNASLVGFDIARFDLVQIPNCKIIQGDQSNRNDLEMLVAASPNGFDVVIDDALHASRHQQVSLGYLFPHLNEGGLYVIEDLHYQPAGYEDPEKISTSELLSGLSCGREIDSTKTWMTSQEIDYLTTHAQEVIFFDSCKRVNAAARHRNAFAVIRKKPTRSGAQ